ncbi:hypothetical protein BDR06DRAFT_1044247 [Suillus hirtellus]|nr:hypothetical protein BDR06DRAFT_1044247 [Suillus hirtellus]
MTQSCWRQLWNKSPRFNCINRIDPKILQCSFVKLTADFPKCLTGMYMALCTGHAPLCQHLHRIGKEPSPFCAHCPGIEEIVPHFLLDCQNFCRERHTLSEALGCNASSLSYLLKDPNTTPHLTRFINTTGQLRQTFSEVPLPRKPPD